LNKLLSGLFDNYQFNQGSERTFELNPITSSFSKLCLLKKYGFNRISFGIQSFNQKVLTLNNRGYQNEKLVKKAINDAKKAGFTNINIDLIIGLYGDNKSSIINSFKKAVSLDISSISLYPMQPRISYLDKYFNSSFDNFTGFLKKIAYSSKSEIFKIIEKNDFLVPRMNINEAIIRNGSWWFIKKDSENDSEELIDHYSAQGINSIFAIGYDSISIIRKAMFYNIDSNQIYQGIPQDRKSRMIYYIFENLANQKWISKKDFKNIFNSNLLKEFKVSLSRLKKLGVIKSTLEDKIYINLFKSNDIFLYSLFFLEEKLGKKVFHKFMEKKNKDSIKEDKKEQIDSVVENVLDGRLEKKWKNVIEIKSKIDNKKIKIGLTKKTEFIKMDLSLPDRSVSQFKTKLSDLKIGDSLSLVVDKQGKKYVAFEVRKIVVAFQSDD